MVAVRSLLHLALLLLLLFVLETARAQDCANITSCVECLEMMDGCGFWQDAGGCATECLIQDVSCFSADTFPDLSAEETCQTAEDQAADASLCSEQTDCEDCAETTLSDGTSTCQWFKEDEYCASACGMSGCGELTCEDEVTEEGGCDGLSCTDCLETEGCGSWQEEGGCASECLIADASCFTVDTFPNLTVQNTCQAAADQAADATLCAEKTTCSDCTSTTMTDGNTTCQWFTDGSYCASACDMNGCGDTECISDDTCFLGTCEECLDAPNCTWQEQGGCAPTCMIQDVSCFTIDTFPGLNASETCQVAADQASDSTLCAGKTGCADCTSTTLSDGNTTCQWFNNGNYCANGCDMNGCGVAQCNSDNDECFLGSCQDCFDSPNNCAWVPDVGCLISCDVIADTECFPSSDYNASDVCTESSVGSTTASAGSAVSTVAVAAATLAVTTAGAMVN